MSTLRVRSKIFLAIGLAALCGLLLIATLPVLGIAAVVLRVALLAVALAALVAGVLAYALNPRFRSWLAAKLDSQPDYMGLRMRDGVRLDDGHSWSRRTRQDFKIGVDDLAQRALGPIDAVDLPAVGSRIERGDPLLSLRHGDRRLRMRAPLSGVIRAHNAELKRQPELINEDPYGAGWAVIVQPSRPQETEHLHGGVSARDWFCREVDRLLQTVVPAPTSVMADGGVVIEDLSRLIDDPLWERLRGEFFELPISRSTS